MPEFEVKVERRRKPSPRWPGVQKILTRPGIVVSGALCAAVLVFGTPHLLVQYHCSGRCSMQHAYACNYYGIQGWRYVRHYDRRGCSMVRLLPLKFR